MPSNSTWVCFHCRKALRRATVGSRPTNCAACGRPYVWIGYKVEIPTKSNAKALSALKRQLQEWQIAARDRVYRAKIRQRHKLERQIAAFEALPANPGRRAIIRTLRSELVKL